MWVHFRVWQRIKLLCFLAIVWQFTYFFAKICTTAVYWPHLSTFEPALLLSQPCLTQAAPRARLRQTRKGRKRQEKARNGKKRQEKARKGKSRQGSIVQLTLSSMHLAWKVSFNAWNFKSWRKMTLPQKQLSGAQDYLCYRFTWKDSVFSRELPCWICPGNRNKIGEQNWCRLASRTRLGQNCLWLIKRSNFEWKTDGAEIIRLQTKY